MAAKKAAKTEEKIWLKSYPPEIAHEIPELAYSSVAGLLEDACKNYASLPAFTCMGKSITYSEVDEKSKIIGGWLQSKGLQKGDRVAIMMPNILQYTVILPAILRAGYVVVNVNPLYTPRELEHQLKDSGAKAIFVLENFATTFEQVRSKVGVEHVVVTSMGDMLGGLKGAIVNLVVRKVKKMVPSWNLPGHHSFKSVISSNHAMAPAELTHDDVAFLQYTGGTTGVSKGATLSNSNVLSNAAQNDEWLNVVDVPDNPTYICALPLYHIFALTVNMIMGMRLGAHNILIPNPRDIPGFVKELGNYDYHVFPGLNTLFNALLNNEDFNKLNFGNLKLTLGGGMAVQQPVAERWQKLTGCNRPEATADTMTKDGYFKSGDMGFMNEHGQTKIVDRKKDMILVSGFNVYPNEVEEVAVGHEHILEAAAVGVPDDHSGEVVKLFIVKTDPSMTEQDVKDWCKKGLTNYKRPAHIEFRDELPKTNVGKILRRELRDG